MPKKLKATVVKDGIVCICGRKIEYGVWVYAHWSTPMSVSCPDCGKIWTHCPSTKTIVEEFE